MLKWIEGFEAYGQSVPSVVSGFSRYTSASPTNIRVTDGRVSGKAMTFSSSSANFKTPVLTTDATLIMGFAWRVASYVAGRIVSFFDGATEGVNLRLKADGELEVYRGGTLLGTTVGAAIGLDTWAYLELKVVTHNSAGSYEVRINGVSLLNATGVDTQQGSNAYHSIVQFNPCGIGANPVFDDVYIFDSTGSTNNDFCGSQRVLPFTPNADGTLSEWTPSTGTDNSALVDEQVLDSDSTYVETAGSGDTDLYDFSDIASMSDIKGIMISTDCRETDGTPFSLHSVIESGGTQSDGTAEPIGSTTYVTKTRIVEQDPNTAAQWTIGGINAAQFGVKIQ